MTPTILVVGASADQYGSDRILLAIAEHMEQKGYQVKVLLPATGPANDLYRRRNIDPTVKRYAILRQADASPRGILRLLWHAPRDLLMAMKWIRQAKADLVWVNTVTIPHWIVAARLTRVKVVCHSHEIVDRGDAVRRALYVPLLFTSLTVCVTEACRNDIVRTYPKLAKKAVVVRNGSFSVTGSVPVSPGHENDVVVMGRLSPRKGQHVLLESLFDPRFKQLPFDLHVCGEPVQTTEGRAYEGHLRDLAGALDRAVHFHGYIEAGIGLSLGRYVVVPSTLPEPGALTTVEAVVGGRILVASDSGGLPELVGNAAILVPPADARALANALIEVMTDEDLRKEMLANTEDQARSLNSDTYLRTIEKLVSAVLA